MILLKDVTQAILKSGWYSCCPATRRLPQNTKVYEAACDTFSIRIYASNFCTRVHAGCQSDARRGIYTVAFFLVRQRTATHMNHTEWAAFQKVLVVPRVSPAAHDTLSYNLSSYPHTWGANADSAHKPLTIILLSTVLHQFLFNPVLKCFMCAEQSCRETSGRRCFCRDMK